MVSNSANCFRSHIRCQTGTHSCLGFVIAPGTDFQDILGEILSHFDQVLYQGHLFCSRVGPMTALLFASTSKICMAHASSHEFSQFCLSL